jgi:hypothetical protein
MRLLALCVAFYLAAPASAQLVRSSGDPSVRTGPGEFPLVRVPGGGPVFSASFATIGAFASGTPADTGQAIAVTRASTATYCLSGSRTSAAANTLRVESGGALIEPAGLNYYLNSDTPTTQTISLATGTYTAWMEGSGSEAVAVGTATATGLPCTASGGVTCGTHGTICTFTVTGAGTVTVTKSGSPTNTTVENNAYPTSYIPTAGTAVARSADTVMAAFSYSLPAQSMCMQADVQSAALSASSFNTVLGLYTDANNFWTWDIDPTSKLRLNGFFSSTSHVAYASSTFPFSPSASHHVVARYDGANETVCVDGTCNSTAYTFSAGTSFIAVLLGENYLSTATPLSGHLANVKVYPSAGSCQ